MRRCGITSMTVGLALATCLFCSPAAAQPDCGAERDPGTGTLDELSWKQLNAIFEDVGEERYDQAYANLQRLLARAGRDEYLQAIVNQALAQVEWARGNYEAALRYFETAVRLDTLPNDTHFALMYQIAQLYFMQDRFAEALERLDLWFCTVPPGKVTAAAHVLHASIHAQRQDYANAVQAIDRAIALDDDPEEAWFQVKLAAHYELGQYRRAAETLEILVSQWPDQRRYWTQLAQIYSMLEQGDRALAVMALAYRRNLLDTQDDIVYLSSLYSDANLPYKAAEVMQEGIREGRIEPSRTHWSMVGDAWYAAEEVERALAAYEQAGQAAVDGDIDLRRSFILVELERWAEALDALDRALGKGGLDEHRTGEAYLLRGMTQFNLGNLDRAGVDWERAARYERSRESARQWINHLQEERRRRAS